MIQAHLGSKEEFVWNGSLEFGSSLSSGGDLVVALECTGEIRSRKEKDASDSMGKLTWIRSISDLICLTANQKKKSQRILRDVAFPWRVSETHRLP